MERTQLDLARNLMQTLGTQRAVHVAKQYCWFGVAEEITRLASLAANDSVAPAGLTAAH